MKLFNLCCSVILIALSFFACGSEQTVTLKIGKPSTPNMPRNHYVLSLLEKALRR